ncbi:zinc finger domain-containing protein [Streptomyces sp. IBSNAI002]|uniref:zinc finger domain-containing protein n=1 Tax=Streptomyces sp. IBSNAI002 TaxID=3457500 RepID=UPI003FD5DF34
MNPEQIPQLLKQVSYADPRILPEDKKEIVGLSALWAGVLADVPAEFAMWAVGQHYAESPFPIKPSDIASRWRAHVRDRMNRHTGTLEPTRYPELDPDDVAGFMHTLRTERQAVIMGQQPPTPLAAITGPDAVPAEVEERLAAVGRYVPDHIREQLAPTWPRRGPDGALAHRCPQCGARPGQHCTTAKAGTRRQQPHGARSHPDAA